MIIFPNEVEILKIVEGKFRLLKKQVLSLSYLLNANITLQLLESITHNDIIKTLQGKSDQWSAKPTSLSWKGKLFFCPTTKTKKNILYSVIRVSKKVRKFLKYRNKQYRSVIWP